jgi:hypothetical protein
MNSVDMPASELPWRNISRAPQGNRCCEEARASCSGMSAAVMHAHSTCSAATSGRSAGGSPPAQLTYTTAAGARPASYSVACNTQSDVLQIKGVVDALLFSRHWHNSANRDYLTMANRQWKQPVSGHCCFTTLDLTTDERSAALLLRSSAFSQSGLKP